MGVVTRGRERADALRFLRGSRRVARSIPLPLRVLDLTLVVLALPLALLVGSVIAAAVFLDSPGPVFYRSRRIGQSGLPFAMLKFRTMVRDAAGPPLSARADARYTPLGQTLAHSRLDELPQLWNVLRGDMRLVGPRPEDERFVRDFPAEYEQILSVPPGLTGPAQVAFAWEGEILARAREVDRIRVYHDEILPYKIAIDLRYAQRHGVLSDLLLIARTVLLPIVRAHHRVQRALEGTSGWQRAVRVGGVLALVLAVVVLAALLAAEGRAPS
jgi:lipopolysaccharide/colanic/teichoic acid biosynthesis glycosyltransferase